MTQIYLDETLRAKLANPHEPFELCDESGQLLGHYTPLIVRKGPQVSDEELERRDREDETFSTEEVLAYLERL